jgi:hypothetical protein
MVRYLQIKKIKAGGCRLESFGSGWGPFVGYNESSPEVNVGEFYG